MDDDFPDSVKYLLLERNHIENGLEETENYLQLIVFGGGAFLAGIGFTAAGSSGLDALFGMGGLIAILLGVMKRKARLDGFRWLFDVEKRIEAAGYEFVPVYGARDMMLRAKKDRPRSPIR